MSANGIALLLLRKWRYSMNDAPFQMKSTVKTSQDDLYLV